jgi:hypothetical protein
MLTAGELPSLRGSALDDLFASAEAGEIPVGKGDGQALIVTGTSATKPLLALVRLLAWRGKEFDPRSQSLRNLISPFGVRAITADVYVDSSRLDGRPCIVLDYSKTSWIGRWVRDEIRQIGPGLYVGLVYVRSHRAPLRFSLKFDTALDSERSEPFATVSTIR